MLKAQIKGRLLKLEAHGSVVTLQADILAILTEMHKIIAEDNGEETADLFIDGIGECIKYCKDADKLKEAVKEKLAAYSGLDDEDDELENIDTMIKKLKKLRKQLEELEEEEGE